MVSWATRQILHFAIAAAMFYGMTGPFGLLPVPANAAERPVAAERNPPGDIPDSQVFVTYESPLGFSIKVPEGWARSERPSGVRYIDKFGIIEISIKDAAERATAKTARDREGARLKAQGHAVDIAGVHDVKLPAGPAVRIDYSSNSAPNAVTGKQIRLENNRYLLFKNGKEAMIDFAAPAGADNVDQWQLMSRSFGWR